MSAHAVPLGIVTKLIYVENEDELPDPLTCLDDELYDLNAQYVFLRHQRTMHIIVEQELVARIPVAPSPYEGLDVATRMCLCVRNITGLTDASAKPLYDQRLHPDGILLTITRHKQAEWHAHVLKPLKSILGCLIGTVR